jgi:hypothetical protein
VDGACFWSTNGGARIKNFPERHSDNCTQKHQDTKGWLKPTVRIFKNLRNTMIKNGTIRDGLAPSCFIEGLLYNVPDGRFGGTEQINFKDVLEWLLAADRSQSSCVKRAILIAREWQCDLAAR